MNESRGAAGNSCTTPATWKGTTLKRPLARSSVRRRAGDPGQLSTPPLERVPSNRSRGSGGDDIGAERQLRVDARLLVVGRGEEAEVDAEGEQQSGHEQATVDRRSTAAGAREQ